MKRFSILSAILLLVGVSAYSASVPSTYLKNQFGEVSNNFVIGGTNQITAKFIVDSTNSNGLGIRELSTTGGADAIAAVYMNTSATPASGNPNPSPGYMIVKFSKGYSGYLVHALAQGNPPSPSLVNVTSGLQQGKPYTIQTVGTTSASAWHALGLPSNIDPVPSPSFIAITSAPAVGTGVVAPATSAGSGISHFEYIGDPSLNVATNDNSGGQIILGAFGSTSATSTVYVPKAPTAGSSLSLSFMLTPVAQPLQ